MNGNDTTYWDNYYSGKYAPKPPSDFAKFVISYVKAGKKLADLGCGNGRDSVYFCDFGLKVTAVDLSKEAIASIDKSKPILTIRDDFASTKALLCMDYDYCYSRWAIHSITKIQQDELIVNVFNSLETGGLFFIEVRTINDSKYGQGERLGDDEFFCDNHYRRFINPKNFTKQLIDTGFSITHCEESDSFSVIGEDRPCLMRIIAEKNK